MRVKRLEIEGFKSFKDKTVIHFDHGITGIVGPNGCGKSNIVDAFFWVMGEQSYKHMRGSGSDDLIFNGSSKYEPLGVAQATIVMEQEVPDTEHSAAGASFEDVAPKMKKQETSVTRRVFRDGHGEYLINGVEARLKDIHELFMDTGVGAKGYSVIEQGQIGKIVNSKPDDRRQLIEEAAGIAKYKARKKESLRKMEATQANLARLTDIVQEIERTMSSLERQANKARKYKEIKEELLEKELTWSRRKNKVLKQRIQQLLQDRDAVEADLAGVRAELQTSENQQQIDQVEHLTQSKSSEDLQTRIQHLSGDLAEARSSLEFSRKRQGDLASQVQGLNDEKQVVESQLKSEEESLLSYESEVANADTTFADAVAKSRTAEEKTRSLRDESETIRRALDAIKRQAVALMAEESQMRSREAGLTARLESIDSQIEKISNQAAAQVAKLEEVKLALQALEASKAEKQSRREAMATERDAAVTDLDAKRANLDLRRKGKAQAESQLSQVRSRLESLEELADAFEGFSEGPKSILQWVRENGRSEELSALADMFEIESGFEGALAAWLDAGVDRLFAAQPSSAFEALEYLGERDSGRAAIQTSMGQNAASSVSLEQVRNQAQALEIEIVGTLLEKVRLGSVSLESKAKSLIEGQMAQVVIVAHHEDLKKISTADTFAGWSWLSLDGYLLEANGLLRGGAKRSDQEAGVLARKRAIQEFKEHFAIAEAAFAEAEMAETSAEEALKAAQQALDLLKTSLQQLEVENAALERDRIQSARTLTDVEAQLSYLQVEKSQLEDQRSSAQADMVSCREILATRSVERERLEGESRSQETAQSEAESLVHAAETELHDLRMAEVSILERTKSLKRELESRRAVLEDRRRRLIEIDRVLERATQEKSQESESEVTLEARLGELTKQFDEERMAYSNLKQNLDDLSVRMQAAMNRGRELRERIDAQSMKVQNAQLDYERCQGELQFLVQNVEEKYGANCLEEPQNVAIQEQMDEPVITAETSAEEEQALGQEVERLKARIQSMGEVNVFAIEEFEAQSKRHEYLVTERRDLEQSIENLEEAIDHINKTSEERYRKAYEAIANRFERLFPIIFGGGSAQLSLVYPENSQDILEAGVEIMAQPPGKKVSNITLLSGGEKALTAISLIFAIFMVKPSPFCVLDEVDAPLDDANIGKFNALLREMAIQSQFIVITHNKKTMELNDTLYGVTMEEPGVSKMVSVELN